jgi:hypothetical protein
MIGDIQREIHQQTHCQETDRETERQGDRQTDRPTLLLRVFTVDLLLVADLLGIL